MRRERERDRNWCILTPTFSFLFQIDGISIGSLDDLPSGAVTTFFKSIRNTLDFDFEDDNEGKLTVGIYISDLFSSDFQFFWWKSDFDFSVINYFLNLCYLNQLITSSIYVIWIVLFVIRPIYKGQWVWHES